MKKTAVGVYRKIFWKNGEYQKSRLLELSDQFHTIRWELVESNPPSEVTAVISRLKCTRISESNTTLVEWSAEYSSDVSAELLKFEQKAFQSNLIEMRKTLTKEPLPIIYHVHEGPSTRVIWLAYELGIPLQIEGVVPESPRVDLRKSKESELVASNKGGMVTSFVEGDAVLIESGAIIFYLLEKYDILQRLSPPIGSPERPKFLKYFFQITSTVDHLVYESYSQTYVVGDDEIANTNKAIWNGHIASQFVDQLSKTEYLAGSSFTAVDVMFGWSLFVANLLGWLEEYPKLKEYLAKLSKRPGYIRAFSELK